jgi:hypothetical protein
MKHSHMVFIGVGVGVALYLIWKNFGPSGGNDDVGGPNFGGNDDMGGPNFGVLDPTSW